MTTSGGTRLLRLNGRAGCAHEVTEHAAGTASYVSLSATSLCATYSGDACPML